MSTRSEDSGIPCINGDCRGYMVDVLDSEPDETRARIVRYRECNTCHCRRTTFEEAVGPVRLMPEGGWKNKNRIGTVDSSEDTPKPIPKSSCLPGQMLLSLE